MSENYTQVNSYQDKLLEAMQIVSSQLISAIPYDKTITCTIINDEDKTKGKYKVTNGEVTFDAYSNDVNLKKDDVVYVTIPEGNYDNQKIIQGKKTSDSEKPFIFTTPFDTMLDVTNNLIIEQDTKCSLIANNGYITKTIECDNQMIEIIEKEQAEFKKICSISGLNLTGYTRLGIKADFMSWLPEVLKGSYGLRITVTDNLNTTTTDTRNVASVQQTKTMLLDVNDMYGSPYSFESYYTQEKVFPIEELNTITDIVIEFYQIAGSFYDINKNILTLQDETVIENENLKTHITKYGENLFVDNISISVGYDVNEITDEYIVPVINDSMTYSAYRESELNKKEIDLRWVHQFEEGPKVVEPREDFEASTARLKDCEIRWYRYKLGAAAADEYSGVYWVGQTVTKQNDKYVLSDWDGQTELIDKKDIEGNIIYDELGKPVQIIKPVFGEKKALTNVEFIPSTDYQTEQIKAIIFLNGVAIRGPVITFHNEQTTTGKEVSDFINALEIECVDGTLGNYLIYNEAGNILSDADSKLERKLSCNFAEVGAIAKSNLLLDYEKGDTISWKFPIKNTMLSLNRCGGPIDYIYNEIQLTNETFISNKYYIKIDEEYEIAIGDFNNSLVYYERQTVDNSIELQKVWTQINEYLDDDKTGFELIKTFEEDGKKVKYYSLYKNNKEYFRNRIAKDKVPYYEPYYEPWNICKDLNENYITLQGARTLKYNENMHMTSILYPTYKIYANYSMYNMNNTIACTIRKDRMIYTSEREFTFGVAGTMGSDKSIVIDFVGGQTAIIANDTSTSYQLEVKMYDENNKPEDISNMKIEWSWYRPGDDSVSDALRFKSNGTAVVELENFGLTLGNEEQIYIAQVSVGEAEAELTTYFPIPIKISEEYSHIEGATSVIYLSNGEPEYHKGDYKLYETTDNSIGTPTIEEINNKVVWEVISQEDSTRFIASINSTGSGTNKEYKGLKPISVYTSGIKNYAVVAKINNNIVWQQPILVIRNKYPSRIINKWDGKTLDIDKEKGTILSTAIAAGKKDVNNTFTGVMIGDWTGSISDKSLTKATGVFGYHQGEMSYALTDNGRFFIGKSGKGRIDFNGDTGEISGGYDSLGNPNMTIDLDDGQITAENFTLKAGNFTNQGTGVGKFLVLNTESETSLPEIGYQPNQHGSYPFEIGKFFKADYTGQIYAEEGTIGAWRFASTKSGSGNEYKSAGSLYSGYGGSYSDIILDPLRNTITGGRFKASVLEALQGTIKLSGFITVYDDNEQYFKNHTYSDETTVKELQYTSENSGGKLGFMTADFGGEIEEYDEKTGEPLTRKNAGIGMSYSGGGTVKATSDNAGLSYKNYYISLQDGKGVMRGTTARLVLQETTETDGATGMISQPHSGLGYNSQYIACNSDGSVVVAALSKISLQTFNTYLSGNLYVGESAVDAQGNAKKKRTYLSGDVEIGQSKEGFTAYAQISGNLSVGSNEQGLTSLTTLNGTTNITTGGLNVQGGTSTTGILDANKAITKLGLQVTYGAKIDNLGLGGSWPDTNYALYTTGNIKAYTGYMQIGDKDNRSSAYVSTLSASGAVTANAGLTASGYIQIIANSGEVDFSNLSRQVGIKAQFT